MEGKLACKFCRDCGGSGRNGSLNCVPCGGTGFVRPKTPQPLLVAA